MEDLLDKYDLMSWQQIFKCFGILGRDGRYSATRNQRLEIDHVCECW